MNKLLKVWDALGTGLEAVGHWATKPAAWWQFWLPQSGLTGGLFLGAVFGASFTWFFFH